jgi:lipoprotein-anchoring transpeptidase ErfK/SrfK
LWYYKEGKLDYETDIVSGQTTSEARTTLPGVYKLWFKDTNFRMQGTNEDGDEWDVTCSYWNNVSLCGIGLHDSAWRGNAFGGNIYKTNGSHGCINMPPAGAKYVYDNVEYGTPVVMYY